jgi:hypothetical protein
MLNSPSRSNSQRLFLALFLVFFLGCLSGCTTVIAGLRNIEDATPFQNNGALLYSRLSISVVGGTAEERAYVLDVGIMPKEPRSMEYVFPSGAKRQASGFWTRLPKGESSLVVTLPPGEYYLHSVQQLRGPGKQYAMFSSRPSFTITGDKINYVGDIAIQVDYDKKTANLAMTDRYEQAIQALSASHPQVSNKFNVVNRSRPASEATERAF